MFREKEGEKKSSRGRLISFPFNRPQADNAAKNWPNRQRRRNGAVGQREKKVSKSMPELQKIPLTEGLKISRLSPQFIRAASYVWSYTEILHQDHESMLKTT